jgi:ADP-ribose pyrophosphatase YjhB (NUDIX family)
MRTDHYYDPDAPTARTIVVATSVFVLDDQGRVLLIRRTDNGLWALPGGTQEVGEYLADTAVRETREETGVDVEVDGIVGIYTNPNHVMSYSDGEVRQQFSVCLRARHLHGEPRTSDESSQVRWIERKDLEGLTIHPSMQLRIKHGFEDGPPYIG